MRTTDFALDQHHFEPLYAASADPWGFRSRWYERRKRALTLAALPHEHYSNAFEAGCANGELAATLAPRCGHLLACDFHQHALTLAEQRLACFNNVQIEQRCLPEQWPDTRFDLIVISELAYYLTPKQLNTLLERLRMSLSPQGVLLACHWRHSITDAYSDGDSIHAALASLSLPRLLRHEEKDFILEAWSPDGRSVADHERLT